MNDWVGGCRSVVTKKGPLIITTEVTTIMQMIESETEIATGIGTGIGEAHAVVIQVKTTTLLLCLKGQTSRYSLPCDLGKAIRLS